MKYIKIALLAVCLLVFSWPQSAQAEGNITSIISSTVASTVSATVSGIIVGRSGGGGGGGFGGGGGGGGSGGGGGGGSGGGGGQSGQSSGDNPLGVGVWALGGANFLDNTKDGAKYDGGLTLFTAGVDKLFGSLLVGVGFGYEKLDLTTKYNTGKIAYDGFSIIPYLSYSITQDLVADASLIFAWLDYTMKDTQAGVKYSDNMSAERRVASAGLTKYLMFDKLLLSGRLGTMYMNEHQGSYQLALTPYGKSGIYTWQGMANVRGTYTMGVFKPFLGATFSRDLMKSGAITNDNWGADLDLGFTYNLTDTLLIGLTGTYGIRENLTKTGGMLNIRYDF